jgi:hypothetical protein
MKRRRIAELEQWEAKTQYLSNFIRTEAKPPIFYKPKIMNPIMECRLEQSKQLVTEMIASKRKLILEDLDMYEEKSKRYWERRLDGHDFRRAEVHPMDQDIEDELKELMKNEELAEVTMTEADDFTITVFRSPEKTIKVEADPTEDLVDSTIKENLNSSPPDGEGEILAEEAEAVDEEGNESPPQKSQEEPIDNDAIAMDDSQETKPEPLEEDY